MAILEVGSKAPELDIVNQNGETKSLADYKGKWLVLYFYPKDNTPGCTTEAKDFSSMIEEFKKNNAEVVGVSPDTVKKHCNFIEKQNLTVELLADPEQKVLESYGVWQLKKNYGKEYMGVVRTTYVIDTEGNIARVWEKVKVKGHVLEVLEYVQSSVK